MRSIMKRPSIERIRYLFSYDPGTGIISRKIGRIDFRGPVGKSLDVSIDGHKFLKSHLAWALHYSYWPTTLIDHKDGNKDNIKLNNLREATHRQNQFNKVGHGKYPKGVVFKADANRKKPWSARIRVHGKKIAIGSYETMEEAAEAYLRWAEVHQGEFALHNSR